MGGSAGALKIKIDVRSAKPCGLGRVDSVLYVYPGAQTLQSFQMEVDRSSPDITAARDRHSGKPKPGEQRTEHAERRAHLAHELVRGFQMSDVCRIDYDRGIVYKFG